MDHCTRCHRSLDGAPNCPSCGVPAPETAQAPEDTTSSPATPGARAEHAYVAKPFHQEPPRDVDPDPEPAAPGKSIPGEVEDDSSRRETALLAPVVPDGAPLDEDGGDYGDDGHGDDGHGDDGGHGDGVPPDDGDDDHRPVRRRRIVVLAAVLCAVLLGVVAFQFGGAEQAPDRPAKKEVAPTKTPDRAAPSPSEPSADASTAEPSPSASAEPTTPEPPAPVEPQPEQPAPGDGEPEDPAPTPPPPSTDEPDPEPTSPAPDPSDDCLLVLCF